MTAVTGPGGRLPAPSHAGRVGAWRTPVATPVEHAAMERRAAVREAVRLLVEGRPGRAEFVMTRSVMAQARALGVGHTHIGSTCGCGRPDCPSRPTGGAA